MMLDMEASVQVDDLSIAIVGAGGHGRVIWDVLCSAGKKVAGFIDDSPEKQGQMLNGLPILGKFEEIAEWKKTRNYAYIVGIGNNDIRKRLFLALKELEVPIASAIHPTAVLAREVTLGEGIVIMANAVINTASQIGDNVCVNTKASVDHDNILRDHCHIFPGATLTGNVYVGEGAYVGTGASVIPGKRIGEMAYVGAGAVVVKDVPDYAEVIGCPAKIRRFRNQ